MMVRNSIAAAIVPLEDGFYSNNRVYEALINGDVDPITGQCSNYNYIREHIVEAQQSLEKSEHMAARELTSLDRHIEILTRDQAKLEQEMRDTRRPIMLAAGGVELDQALHAVREAEEEVRNSESQMEKFKSNMSKYQSEIHQVEQDIRQKHDKVERIHEEIQRVKEKRETVAEFQQNVRRTVHILSVLSGKISVAECQTRRFILQKPVMKVMEDLMKSAEDIAGNQLLCNEGMLSLINAMKENSGKLAAICNFPSDADDDAY
ncbi:hypothetical protein NFI96_014292 [Prochilodus magdalenae]|nr:hypothetical protein NFI96_014292 [Prochilodus magdalenae]